MKLNASLFLLPMVAAGRDRKQERHDRSESSASNSSEESQIYGYQVWMPRVPFSRAAKLCQANGLKLAPFDPVLSRPLLEALKAAKVKSVWTGSSSPINKAALINRADPKSDDFSAMLLEDGSFEMFKRHAVLCQVTKKRSTDESNESEQSSSSSIVVKRPPQKTEKKKSNLKKDSPRKNEKPSSKKQKETPLPPVKRVRYQIEKKSSSSESESSEDSNEDYTISESVPKDEKKKSKNVKGGMKVKPSVAQQKSRTNTKRMEEKKTTVEKEKKEVQPKYRVRINGVKADAKDPAVLKLMRHISKQKAEN